ncbi:formate dehydrogenase subunit beta [Anaeromyxobacter paludicola]|uniref:Nitrate-inducible formate dehydrogenase subunit beta n=1 Tax=Anaeromyxobacter paludicola TaxID=2918171 RepID=A0ABN6NE14_9BACT|nr:formate dehydrogenase subunit beta [Anaeromyxobacter paludicola]BDG10720.1 nitrate-inducible formate dehydrogenase subunit beta [Anaeromyxobacter paludicola]
MALESLDVRRRSASETRAPDIRSRQEVAKLIDISRCIGCKACQAACMEWNDLREEVGATAGAYDNPADLTASSWTVMRFFEEELPERGLQWLIVKDGCLHCSDPGCLKACPAPGAIVQLSNGIVDFQQEACIGCGYCQAGCPFDVPRYSPKDDKAYKCTLCSDRVAVGLEPACIKTCPTQALSFGAKEDMRALADERVGELKERGYGQAQVYDPSGVGGTHVLYVMPHGDPALYRKPRDPSISPLVALWRSTFARTLGAVTMGAVFLAGFFHWMKVGPVDPDARPEGGEEKRS